MKKTFLLLITLCFAVIMQAQVSKIINVTTPGSLSTSLTETEKKTVTNLTLIGRINASDFKTMRDDMSGLKELDLSWVTVVAYNGNMGTAGWDQESYAENTIPESAFEDCDELTTILLPASITTIESWAFDWCTSLESVNIPSSVRKIEEEAFDYCISLKSVFIPASVDSISSYAFRRGSGPITVDENNVNYSSIDGVLFNKQRTELIFCPISKEGIYIIPSSVINVGNDAFDDCLGLTTINIPNTVRSIGIETFYDCSGLTSINIPKYVTSLGNTAFSGCIGLNSIYTYTIIPIDLINDRNVFERVNQNTCVLYVPKGSKSSYQYANQWKDFKNIVEMPDFYLSSTTVNLASILDCKDSITITSNIAWTASSDQKWLTINPASGTGIGKLTFTATANPNTATRTATVTVSATGVASQIVTVTQAPLTGVATLEVSSTTISITNETNSLATVNISSNAIWSASSNQSWLTVSPASGTGNGTITFTATANPTTTARMVTVIVSATGVASQTITVTQAAGTAVLIVSSNTLSMIKEANGTTSINIISNTEWIVTSDQPWLTIDPASGTGNRMLTFTATENTTNISRIGIVTFSATGDVSQIVTVTQASGAGTGTTTKMIDEVSLYPNPATDGFWLEGVEETTLSIADLNGRLWLTKEISGNEYISLSAFAQGVYTVSISNKEGKLVKKIIKK